MVGGVGLRKMDSEADPINFRIVKRSDRLPLTYSKLHYNMEIVTREPQRSSCMDLYEAVRLKFSDIIVNILTIEIDGIALVLVRFGLVLFS